MQRCPNYKDRWPLSDSAGLTESKTQQEDDRTNNQSWREGSKSVKRKNKEGHFRAGITKEEEMFERKTQLYIMMLIFSLVSLI